MKKLIYTAALLLCIQFAQAQSSPCGTDEQYKAFVKEHPEAVKDARYFNNSFAEYLKTTDLAAFKPGAQGMGKKAVKRYIIPVVFHILHNYNQSRLDNITDQDVINEMIIVNRNYRAASPFRNRIREVFRDIEGDAEIEFRLAKLDPEGNPTNGIERFYIGELSSKSNDFQKRNSWDPTRYLNIWVTGTIRINSPFDVGGYAYKPTGIPNAKYDGPIVLGSTVGLIGSGNPFSQNTVGHEIGHYLGLDHPFNQSEIDSCSLDGDGVFDTPPTYFTPGTGKFAAGQPGCPLGCSSRNFCSNPDSNSCGNDNPDLPDQYENFMDYFEGPCSNNMFTLQQVARMRYSLENYRKTLWTDENLKACGVFDSSFDSKPVPKASFNLYNNNSLSEVRACVGKPVTFREDVYNAKATAWEWDFGSGATPATYTGQNPPAVTYSTAGYKTITLKVTGANGSNTLKKENYLFIEGPQDSKKGMVTWADWDYQNDFLAKGWYFENEYPEGGWNRVTDVKYDGIASLKLSARTSPSTGSQPITGFNYALVSPSFDLTNAANPYLQFNYAFAPNIPTNSANKETSDRLYVLLSTDCGLTWQTRKVLGGSSPNTLSTITGGIQSTVDFKPTGPAQWKTILIDGQSPVTGIPKQNNVRFKIVFEAAAGNNFYIDNLAIGVKTGVNNITRSTLNMTMQPNPFDHTMAVSYQLQSDLQADVRLFDILGKEVGTIFTGHQDAGMQQLTIDRDKMGLQSGIYFIKLDLGGAIFSQKVIVN